MHLMHLTSKFPYYKVYFKQLMAKPMSNRYDDFHTIKSILNDDFLTLLDYELDRFPYYKVYFKRVA